MNKLNILDTKYTRGSLSQKLDEPDLRAFCYDISQLLNTLVDEVQNLKTRVEEIESRQNE